MIILPIKRLKMGTYIGEKEIIYSEIFSNLKLNFDKNGEFATEKFANYKRHALDKRLKEKK